MFTYPKLAINPMSEKVYVVGDDLHYDAYWHPGNGMGYLREALEHDHPEQLYNYLKRNGIEPELYGVFTIQQRLTQEKYNHLSKEQLINKLVELEIELMNVYKKI
jgi:hypothetical protein